MKGRKRDNAERWAVPPHGCASVAKGFRSLQEGLAETLKLFAESIAAAGIACPGMWLDAVSGLAELTVDQVLATADPVGCSIGHVGGDGRVTKLAEPVLTSYRVLNTAELSIFGSECEGEWALFVEPTGGFPGNCPLLARFCAERWDVWMPRSVVTVRNPLKTQDVPGMDWYQ